MDYPGLASGSVAGNIRGKVLPEAKGMRFSTPSPMAFAINYQ